MLESVGSVLAYLHVYKNKFKPAIDYTCRFTLHALHCQHFRDNRPSHDVYI